MNRSDISVTDTKNMLFLNSEQEYKLKRIIEIYFHDIFIML